MRCVDLGELTNNGEVRILAGHERGVAAREKFCLDDLDAVGEAVTVLIPEAIYALSPSFIQGLFTKSIRAAGSRERFLKRYSFDASLDVLQQLDESIDTSLLPRTRSK